MGSKNKTGHIFKKILFSFLFFSILPLLVFSLITAFLFKGSNERILNDTKSLIDNNIEKNLMIQANQISRKIEIFLRNREFDLISLSTQEMSDSNLVRFSRNKTSQVWMRTNRNEDSLGVWRFIPLYKEVEFVDLRGNQKVKIADGKVFQNWQKGNISNPLNTTYFSEQYFSKSFGLSKGEIYTSHLNGFFVSEEEYKSDAKVKYNGVIRFATPVFKNNIKVGILILGLDQRHLMEFTQHVQPNSPKEKLYPDYSSGNYAFMFDDEGWIITHPKIWDIRGVNGNGQLVPPYSINSTKDDIQKGIIPFNLNFAGFIHPNYPIVYNAVINKQSGRVLTTNVGGTKKIMVYSPILYNTGIYKKFGVFGGITVGIETQNFHSTSFEINRLMIKTFNQYLENIFYVIGGSIVFSFIVSFFFSRNLTKPIIKLTRVSKNLSDGKFAERIELRRNDEIGSLANSFNKMAKEIERSHNQLIQSNVDLEDSRANLENYSHNLEHQLNILESIQSISNTIGLLYNLDSVLKTILSTSVEKMNFDRTVLYLINSNSENLEFRESCGIDVNEILTLKNQPISLNDQKSLESFAVNSRKVYKVDNICDFLKANDLNINGDIFSDCHSFVLIPLFIQEKIIGILGAAKLKDQISEADLSSFQILANQASRVIENSHLYSELISQRNFVDDIITNMLNGVISTNGKGVVTSINKAAIEILDLPKENLVGENIWEILSQDENFKQEIIARLNSEKIYKAYEKEVVLKGKKKFVNMNASRVFHNNIHTSTIIIVEDVSDKKMLDEELKRKDRLASLGQFATGIAHEIRNPLTGLSLFLDNLYEHIASVDSNQSKLILSALKEIERLDNLVNEVLEFALPRSSKMISNNINETINSLFLFLKQQLLKSKVELIKEFDENIPAFRYDSEKMRQAFLNIILNSLKFMPNGGKLYIKTSLIKKNNQFFASIKITDTGHGLKDKESKDIFEPFYSGRKEGTGLGLAITHSIVKEHGGTVSAKNSQNFGAEFKIIIPIEK